MSDGYSDAVDLCKNGFDEWVEFMVANYEDPIAVVAACAAQGIEEEEKMRCRASWLFKPIHILESAVDFRDASVARFFSKRAASKLPFSLDELFLILHNSGRLSLLQRLQKASGYGNRLLIFFDSEGRLADNGIHYRFPAKFFDGDQDVLLGIAKKAYGGELRKGVPFMIVASRHFTRKRWHFDRLCQIPVIAA